MTGIKLLRAVATTAALISVGSVGIPTASARPMRGTVVLHRDRPMTVQFDTRTSGEALLSLAASADGVDWGRAGAESAVVDRFRAGGCLNEQAATDAVREEFTTRGLSDWTVATESKFSAARPCASLAFEPEAKRVSLVPMPAGR